MFPRCVAAIVSWRSVSVLAALASVLQLTNIVLTWQLRQRDVVGGEGPRLEDSDQPSQPVRRRDLYLGQRVSEDHQLTLTRIARWGVLDGSGGYRVAVGAVRGTGTENGRKGPDDKEQRQPREIGVTLVTQCSLQLLYKIPHLVKYWQGAVSVAVFAVGSEVVSAVQAVHYLRRCYPEVKQNVTFSLVHPLGTPPSQASSPQANKPPINPIPSVSDPSCNLQQLEWMAWRNYEYQGIEYPNNLLRNAARKAVTTPFMFVIDVDMTPSQGLVQSFSTFIQGQMGHGDMLDGFKGPEDTLEGLSRGQGGKTVWVVPAYEIREDAKEPTNKKELLAMRELGQARPFYQELCLKCQKFTDYSAWEAGGGGGSRGVVRGLYEVLWRDPWEPFYLSPTSVPPYDERFRQYGFNRISQVCELHVAGYKFVVLDSAFLTHRGFKTSTSLHHSKDADLEHNRVLFRQFKVDLKSKYPESSRRCY